jgi:phosphoglycolate phosphatase
MPMRDVQQRRFQLLVFDWDGTLADSTTLIGECIQAACGDLGAQVPDDLAARHVIGLGLADALQRIAPQLPVSRHAELADRYRYHYLARELDISLFAGAIDLLSELHAAGYALAVATGKTRAGLNRVLARSGLEQHFHATRCADEGRPKPHPDMLLYLMDRLAVTPERTLMIGDTTHDLQLARRAGASAVAVAYGAHPGGVLAGEPSLAVLSSIAELRVWLAQAA